MGDKTIHYPRCGGNFGKNILCASLGICIGIACITLPPAHAFAIVAGTILLAIAVARPEIGILAIVILIASIVFEDSLPLVPIGIGSLHISDVLMSFLFLTMFYRMATDGDFRIVKSPLNVPLALYVLFAVFSAFVSVKLYGVDFNEVFRILRSVSYYLIYFLVANLIREKKQVLFLVKGMFAVATVVAVVMLVQAKVGDAVKLIPGRVERSGTFDQEYAALRLLPPGQTLLYVFLIVAICVYSMNLHGKLLKSGYLYLIAILGAGVILTYNRTYWVAILLSICILFFLMNNESRKRLLALAGIIVFVACTFRVIYIDNSQLQESIDAVTMRFTSLLTGDELHESSSVKARYVENGYALEQIAVHPVIGIGLGNEYRPKVFLPEDDFTFYVHNGFIWILLNTGIIGFSLFFWFYLGFIVRSFRKYKFIKDDYMRHVVVGFMLSGIGIIPMTLYNPIFMQWFSIVVIAIIVGLTESAISWKEV